MWSTGELDKLAADLGNAGRGVAREADRAVRVAGFQVVGHAQRIAPVDTGTLVNSIGSESLGPGVVEAGPTVNYGPPVEYGTYKMRAQPYMNPAADAVEPTLAAALVKIAGDFL